VGPSGLSQTCPAIQFAARAALWDCLGLGHAPAPRRDDALVARTLSRWWGLVASAVHYLPKGAGSYHWVVAAGPDRYFVAVDDLASKPWIGGDAESAFVGLARCYQAAWDLQNRSGLDLVVGPVPTAEGGATVRLAERYSLTLFPFIDGAAGEWADPLTPALAGDLVLGLGRLHQVSPADLGLSERPFDITERAELATALGALDRPWTAGPHSEDARLALAAGAGSARAWLSELDALAAQLAGEGTRRVVTHGEPHPGNLIRTDAGLRLVDWDTVALAPPERDVWMLAQACPECVPAYEAASGQRLSPGALQLFELAWTLSDIAAFAAMFRARHPDTGWVRLKLDAFRRLLAGERSAPYAQP